MCKDKLWKMSSADIMDRKGQCIHEKKYINIETGICMNCKQHVLETDPNNAKDIIDEAIKVRDILAFISINDSMSEEEKEYAKGCIEDLKKFDEVDKWIEKMPDLYKLAIEGYTVDEASIKLGLKIPDLKIKDELQDENMMIVCEKLKEEIGKDNIPNDEDTENILLKRSSYEDTVPKKIEGFTEDQTKEFKKSLKFGDNKPDTSGHIFDNVKIPKKDK